ncbi:unnamed protein product [Peniophora sp. CBMAI 1063]|nr:unnamed protein product [Peniophora sp. CBMAI 1063]
MENVAVRPGRLRALSQILPRGLVSLQHRRRYRLFGSAAGSSSTSVDTHLPSPSLSPPALVDSVSCSVIPPSDPSDAIAKDTLLFGLQVLAESADAFPPLKSLVGGLLSIAGQVELLGSNKSQINEIYAELDAFTTTLARGIPDTNTPSAALKSACQSLAQEVEAICTSMNSIARQRLYRSFLRAKGHSRELQSLARRLNLAHNAFRTTLLISMELKTTLILASVPQAPPRSPGQARIMSSLLENENTTGSLRGTGKITDETILWSRSYRMKHA